MRFFYSCFVHCYGFVIFIASVFNSKAKLWINGRKNIFTLLKQTVPHNKPVFWIHCASLGEFEQGRPLIEKIKKEHSEYFILLTFFSPSGFENCKNYSTANAIFYLPLDTKTNAKYFLQIVKPKIVCFVKYEYWFNFIDEIYKQNIPLYVISAIFRKNQYFFTWYGKWSLKQLHKITHFFAQNEQTKKLLVEKKIYQVSVSGDTRFDRVIELAKLKKDISIAQKFSLNTKVLVAGSTWSADDDIIIKALKNNKQLKLIVAPHELSESSLKTVEEKYTQIGKVIRFSNSNINNVTNSNVLLIDNVGMLSSLYFYAFISYIGGGFGKGIHNILEAATYGKPIFFGPNYKKFSEAKELIQLKGAKNIESANELSLEISKLIEDEQLYKEKSNTCLSYVTKKQGATIKIIDFLFKKLPAS